MHKIFCAQQIALLLVTMFVPEMASAGLTSSGCNFVDGKWVCLARQEYEFPKGIGYGSGPGKSVGENGGGGGARAKLAPVSVSETAPEGKLSCNPVLLTTGEKLKYETDFSGSGLHGLTVGRTYRSKNTSGTLFGPNWMSSIDYPALVPSTQTIRTWSGHDLSRHVVVTWPNGTKHEYSLTMIDDGQGTGGTYTARDSLAGGTLNLENGRWVLYAGNTTYEFGGGLLESVSDSVTGSGITYSYPNSSQVLITSAGGQTLLLTMGPNGRVAKVRDSAGFEWLYFYNSAGMLNKVVSPGSDPDIREYHYENTNASNAPTLLTGISINGIRHSKYSYYLNRHEFARHLQAVGNTAFRIRLATSHC